MSVALSPSSQSVDAGVAATITLSFSPSGGLVDATFSDGGRGGVFSPPSLSSVPNNTTFTYTNATPASAPPYTITATVTGAVSGVGVCTVTVTSPSTITFDEIAPGTDFWQTPEVNVFSVDEGAPGSDVSAVVYREIVIDEGAPGHDFDIGYVPTVVWEEGAPGSDDGTGSASSACTLRERSKYCPNGDGTYNIGYPVTHVSSENHVDINPSTYINITDPVTVSNPFTIPPNSGIDVETPIEAAVSWWRPLTNGYNYRLAKSTKVVGEVYPDDTSNGLMKGFLADDTVAFTLRVTRTGRTHLQAGQIVSDGHGGWRFDLRSSDLGGPISDVQEFTWNARIGTPTPQIFLFTQGVLGFHATDSEECFEVNPDYDLTVNDAIICDSRSFSGGNFGNFIYQLQATIWDQVTIEWTEGYYTYSINHYTCCMGDCPPCTGPPVTIPSGTQASICLNSVFVICSELPGGSAITGPEPFADEMVLVSQVGCRATIQAPCLTQAQVNANKYQGPYTVSIPLTSKCLQNGSVYRCEMLVGTFFLSAFEICDTGGVAANPFSLQDEHGRYHITGAGGDGSYKRSNFGTNKGVGWATESSLSAPAGRSLHDLRVIVDNRQTVWACYAQQVIADSSWDGVYYRTSNDDGATWEDAVLAISGGKHPTIAIGTDGTFDVVVIAAYVGPSGGPGAITAKSRSAGDTDFGDPFNFKDTNGNDLAAEDDTFHIQQARDDQSRWMLHIVIHSEGASTQWTSFDECKTWEKVT